MQMIYTKAHLRQRRRLRFLNLNRRRQLLLKDHK
jgi:hypothetical protein